MIKTRSGNNNYIVFSKSDLLRPNHPFLKNFNKGGKYHFYTIAKELGIQKNKTADKILADIVDDYWDVVFGMLLEERLIVNLPNYVGFGVVDKPTTDPAFMWNGFIRPTLKISYNRRDTKETMLIRNKKWLNYFRRNILRTEPNA